MFVLGTTKNTHMHCEHQAEFVNVKTGGIKQPLGLKTVNESSIFKTNFGKYSNIKFHDNLSRGSRVVPCRWRDRQTDRQT